MRHLYIIIIFLLVNIYSSHAGVGCYTGAYLYTQPESPGSLNYDRLGGREGASTYCLRTGTSTTGNCVVRFCFFGCTVVDTGVRGDYGAYNPPTYCPLDDYIWLLSLPLGGLGFAYMRKRSSAIGYLLV